MQTKIKRREGMRRKCGGWVRREREREEKEEGREGGRGGRGGRQRRAERRERGDYKGQDGRRTGRIVA